MSVSTAAWFGVFIIALLVLSAVFSVLFARTEDEQYKRLAKVVLRLAGVAIVLGVSFLLVRLQDVYLL